MKKLLLTILFFPVFFPIFSSSASAACLSSNQISLTPSCTSAAPCDPTTTLFTISGHTSADYAGFNGLFVEVTGPDDYLSNPIAGLQVFSAEASDACLLYDPYLDDVYDPISFYIPPPTVAGTYTVSLYYSDYELIASFSVVLGAVEELACGDPCDYSAADDLCPSDCACSTNNCSGGDSYCGGCEPPTLNCGDLCGDADDVCPDACLCELCTTDNTYICGGCPSSTVICGGGCIPGDPNFICPEACPDCKDCGDGNICSDDACTYGEEGTAWYPETCSDCDLLPVGYLRELCQTYPDLRTALGCLPTHPNSFIYRLRTILIGVGSGIALLMMIIGSFQILVSRGNPESVKSGKATFTSGAVGLLLMIFAVFLLEIVGVDLLGLFSSTPL